MEDTFMCDIWTPNQENQEVDLDQILIKASTLDDALARLENTHKYTKCSIVARKDNMLLIHAELGPNIYHIIIGKPSNIIE